LLFIQLKPRHYRLDVLTLFQRGARGVVFHDTCIFILPHIFICPA